MNTALALVPTPAPAAQDNADDGPLRILLVDDDDLDRMATRRAIDGLQRSVEVTEVVTAGEALAELHRSHFDCVLLDYVLPDSNGLSVLEYLAALPELRCAVIMLTGEGDEAVATRAMQSGAHDYISKGQLNQACLERALDNALEKVKLRFDLEKQRRQLERRNEELEQYAYVISHDLQEPLRAITSFVQLLQTKYAGRLDEKADQYINFTVTGTRRMHEMISSLLELSRIGRDDYGITSVDLDEVVSVALANLNDLIERTGAQVSCEPLPTIQGNRTRMIQLFQNLVGNAIRYHDQGHPEVRISAQPLDIDQWEKKAFGASTVSNDYWQFCVEDNGIGIDPEFHDRIFGIFQRLHDREQYDGSGIGLSVCKKIVENHLGRIWFESVPGQGSRFFFTLPSGVALQS